jgi:uncharacterized protein (TIGR03437 family)
LYNFSATDGGLNGLIYSGGVGSPITIGPDGSVYGVLQTGGPYGQGSVYKVTPGGTLTTLFSFGANTPNPGPPNIAGPLILASDGGLYGVTSPSYFSASQGNGTVFRIATSGSYSTVYTFTGNMEARAGLMQATDGNFYGTALNVLTPDGVSTIFKLTPSGKLTPLYNLGATPNDGVLALAPMMQSSDGSLWGTTAEGGAYGEGSVFQLKVPGLGSAATPSIVQGGIVPASGITSTIQPGEWASIFGANLASGTTIWNGDFPTSLGGTTVAVNGKPAYLSYVSPTQINFQAPNDTATGPVPVVVTAPAGTATSTVTLATSAPSFLLLDSKHVAGIILRSNGKGAFGGGTYDILGPTGSSLGYPTVAAKAGDTVELFAVGLGPTNPAVPAGQIFAGAAPTTIPVTLGISGVKVTPSFSGLTEAGVYQLNVTIPAGLVTGDVTLSALVASAQTQPNVVISLQ